MAFEVGDVCILTEQVERDFGVVPVDTVLEITKKYNKSLQVNYAAKTMACMSCDMVLHLSDLPGEILQDYDDRHPRIG